MFLKSLVLNGFKSFAEHSEINFVRGISAIVGPNGCGKSNIVDAIKWVIGEQKTKDLRANSMTDVIFKGTEHKRGLGRAEVSLVFVNDKNILPIEFNEVEITRVIFASGENEYYINKKRVRLKDVQELFFDTGVGKAAYSVMAQGKIDQILSNKPEDRRFMIEEAAGITKYKIKGHEASLRLKQANENIVRIKDILDEVKSQYNHMKGQSEKAVKYKALYDKEINLEIELNLYRIIKHKNARQEFQEKLDKATAQLEEIKGTLNNLEDGIEEQIQNLTSLENQKIESQREVFKIQSDIKVLNSKNEIYRSQISQYDLSIKSDTERIIIFNKKIAEIEEELSSIELGKEELDDQIASIYQDNEFYMKNIAELEEEMDKSQQMIGLHKESINQFYTDLEQKRVIQKEATEKLIVKIDDILNEMDLDNDRFDKLKKKITDSLDYLLKNLPSKKAFIDDVVKTGYLSKDSSGFLKMLEGLGEELLLIHQKTEEVDTDFKTYINTSDKLLNEILGSDGAFTQKRKIETEINEILDSINDSTEKIEELQETIDEKQKKKEEFNKVLNELKINLSTARERKKSIDNDVKRLKSMIEQQESSRVELNNKIEHYQNMIEEVTEELDENEYALRNYKDDKQKLEMELIEIDKKIRDENNKMSSKQQNIKDINTRWMDIKGNIEKFNIKIAEANTSINSIYESFYENYSINIEEYESHDNFKDLREYDVIRKDLMSVKEEKSGLGSVNLMAIEEAKTLEERYNLLTEQLNDLEKAREDIQKMLAEINKISREMFLKTFQEIKVNFHQVFRKLFDGGNAELKLTNPDGLLDTGIDIIAHPPGQKTQSITLLSGGQRTMTAIALMFATFLVKPSPFCLMDEIDAALDEQNVRRLINLLHEFKDISQFIIITHNSKTISAADVMFGVTQEQKGISKIVSAKFAQKVS